MTNNEKIKKLLATIILLYLLLAYFWPEIFLKNYPFLIILVLAGLVFFFELKLKEKVILLVTGGTLGLFLFEVLPTPFAWFLSPRLPLPLVISLGILFIFLFILIEVKMLSLIYKKFIEKRIK